MSMCLQMIQKPPVIFTQYDPAKVISQTDKSFALGRTSRRSDAISWLWICYSRSVLANVDPCMEANEGAAATIAFTSCYKRLSRMEVKRMQGDNYRLMLGDACLYLTETEAGDVFLYFFSPEKHFNRREECRIDLTDFGSDAAAYFIATIFDSYEGIAGYYETNKCILTAPIYKKY